MIANRSTQCAAPVGSDSRLQAMAGVAPIPSTTVDGTVHGTYLQMIGERLSRVPLVASRTTNIVGSAGTIYDNRQIHQLPGYEHLSGQDTIEGERHWEDVPGVGSGPNQSFGYAADGSADIHGTGHGSNSLVLHEYGHNVDQADGFVSSTAAWKDGPFAEAQFCSAHAYTRTYASEWFAASFDFYSESPRTNALLKDRCPTTHQFFSNRYGDPRFDHSYRGWGFAVARDGGDAVAAYRWTGAGYESATLAHRSWIYIYPYGSHADWRWAWQNGTWHAVRAASTGLSPHTRAL